MCTNLLVCRSSKLQLLVAEKKPKCRVQLSCRVQLLSDVTSQTNCISYQDSLRGDSVHPTQLPEVVQAVTISGSFWRC